MTRDFLKQKYFNWMCELVSDNPYNKHKSYTRLLKYLDNIEFIYIMEMDENRAQDGVDFRYRFGYELGYDNTTIKRYLDKAPCSVLEMMISLAFRCEEDIMGNPDLGDRTGCWFWEMINSLGLSDMDDSNFNSRYTDEIIDIFLTRRYKSNGQGGLFTLKNCKVDLRTVDIWYQMHWYLKEIQNCI